MQTISLGFDGMTLKDTRPLQENILMSHSAGVGEPLDAEIVRAVMALRIKDLVRGHSGIRHFVQRHCGHERADSQCQDFEGCGKKVGKLN